MLKSGQRFAKAFRQLPFLIPISWQCTNDQPTQGIYQKLVALESDAVADAVVRAGLPGRRFQGLRGRACSPMAGPRPMRMRPADKSRRPGRGP
jgi:hypothetical protein